MSVSKEKISMANTRASIGSRRRIRPNDIRAVPRLLNKG